MIKRLIRLFTFGRTMPLVKVPPEKNGECVKLHPHYDFRGLRTTEGWETYWGWRRLNPGREMDFDDYIDGLVQKVYDERD